MTSWHRLGQALAWAVLAFALDQFTKWLALEFLWGTPRPVEITPFLNLRLGFNYGVSFGLFRETLENWPGLFAGFKVAVAAGLLAWAMRSPLWPERVGLGLIAGGALGNALDRWRQGAVTDFIDLQRRRYRHLGRSGTDAAGSPAGLPAGESWPLDDLATG